MVFPREYNTVDPTGSKAWDTIRDLSRIWASPLNTIATSPLLSSSPLVQVENDAKTGYLFGPANTILIDNEPRKTRNYQGNAINISSWERPTISSYEMIVDNELIDMQAQLTSLLHTRRHALSSLATTTSVITPSILATAFDVRQWIPTNARVPSSIASRH
jgi:hypothetical protein